MQMKSHILLARPLSPPRSGCKRCTLLHPINLGSKSRLPKLFDIFGTLCICMCKYVCTYIYTQLRQVSFFLQESPLLYSSGKKMKVAGQFGGPSRQRQQPPLLNPEKWVGSRDKILCELAGTHKFGSPTPNNGWYQPFQARVNAFLTTLVNSKQESPNVAKTGVTPNAEKKWGENYVP